MNISAAKLIAMMPSAWKKVIDTSKVPFDTIAKTLNRSTYCPKLNDIYAALNGVSPEDVKVVIIGQDPYHQPNVAHGYSFSVNPSASIPPSLRAIHSELMNEYGLSDSPMNGSLLPWVKEGVLLLNTILTVELHKPASHKGIGWEELTSQVLSYVDNNCTCVFMAWGGFATKLCEQTVKNNVVITSGHPSPLNTGNNSFAGCECFKKANEALMSKGILPVRWTRLWTFNNLDG